MADVFLAKVQPLPTAAGRRSFAKGLRETARGAVPKEERRYKVGPLNRHSFKIEVPGGNGTVHHDGAHFDLDEPEAPILSLLYALAKAGGMAMVEAGPGTILFDKAQLKILPAELRRPKPVICSSVAELARMLGFSLKAVREKTKP